VASIGPFVGILMVQFPVLAVLVAGLIILSMPGRQLPGRSGWLARAGLGVLLAQVIASMVWSGVFTQIVVQSPFDMSVSQYGILSAIVGFMLAVFFAAGLGLLIAAFVSARSPAFPGGGVPRGNVPGSDIPGGTISGGDVSGHTAPGGAISGGDR
jgi:hypothetical protein